MKYSQFRGKRPTGHIRLHGIDFTIDQSVPITGILRQILQASAERNRQRLTMAADAAGGFSAYVSPADPALIRSPAPGQFLISYPAIQVVEVISVHPNAPPG